MSLSETAFHTVLQIHQKVYEGSGGWVGHRALGKPTLLLHTVGRRSGQPRTAALVYAKDDGRYIVVASKGGAPEPPGWLLNLQSQPEVDVQVGRDRGPARATVIQRGDPDYDRLWTLVNDNNNNRFAAYQEKTSRPIPLVALTPAR